jgi:hypothetical protein
MNIDAPGNANSPCTRRMTVSLQEVTADTVRVICALQTTEEQKHFVAPNALSMAHVSGGRKLHISGGPKLHTR